jgi:hypothetical protein
MTCEELKSQVMRWVGEEIECQSVGSDRIIATLPLLKPNGDAIEIGIEQIDSHRLRLSDLGDTRASLYLAGVNVGDDLVRGAEFNQIITDYSLEHNDSELALDVSAANLAENIFEFVHAVQSILALQLTVKPRSIVRDFPIIVANFFYEKHVKFEMPQPVEGKSGRWKFNFMLNSVREPALVKTLSAATPAQAVREAELSVFQIGDIKSVKPIDAIVITDDEGERQSVWGRQAVRIFGEYNVPAYSFVADREELTEFVLKYAAA